MARSELDSEFDSYMEQIVRGEIALFEGTPPIPDVTAYMYFQFVVLNDEVRPTMRKSIGEEFESLIRERLRSAIPQIIERLRDAPLLAAIENELMLIVRGSELFELKVEDYIPRHELLPLAHTAFVRSARAFREEYGDEQPTHLIYACAGAMGVTAAEMGLDPAFLEHCIDEHLYRGHKNPRLAKNWERHMEERRYLEAALA